MKTNSIHKNWEVLFFSISFNLALNLSSIADLNSGVWSVDQSDEFSTRTFAFLLALGLAQIRVADYH